MFSRNFSSLWLRQEDTQIILNHPPKVSVGGSSRVEACYIYQQQRICGNEKTYHDTLTALAVRKLVNSVWKCKSPYSFHTLQHVCSGYLNQFSKFNCGAENICHQNHHLSCFCVPIGKKKGKMQVRITSDPGLCSTI